MEEYFAKDVESELGLSQTKLIRLAMLLGSDYTEGINGIGACFQILLTRLHPLPSRLLTGSMCLCFGGPKQRPDSILAWEVGVWHQRVTVGARMFHSAAGVWLRCIE